MQGTRTAAALVAALGLTAACSGGSPQPASGPPALRFEVLAAGLQPTTVFVSGPKVTSSFGSTSLGYSRGPRVPTPLPYVSPLVQVSQNARYEMHVSVARSSPSVLGVPSLIVCKVLLRNDVVYERTAARCDVSGRL